MAKTMCCTCRKVTEYTLHSRVASRQIGRKEIVFHEKYATCNECGSEVAVAGLDGENALAFDGVYYGLRRCGLI